MLTSIKKATRIIEAFIGERREWTVSQLAEHLGMPQPTIHHFLASFREAGWIVQNPSTKQYRLGVRLWEIGCAAVNFGQIAESARPILRELVNEIGETVHLGMVSPEDPLTVVYIDRVDSSRPVRVVTVLGSHSPSHASAMGKAIVAHNPGYEEAVLKGPLEKVTPRTITDPEQLREEFALTRERGYSIGHGEFAGEMIGIAAPVHDRVGAVTLGIGIWSPAAQMTEAFIAEAMPKITDAASRLSAQLGYVARG